MKIAHYEETIGKLIGWYDRDIHTTLPTPNIEVTEADWKIAIDANYNYVDTTNNTLSTKDFRTFVELQISKIAKLKQSRDESNTLSVIVNITDIATSTTADYNFHGGLESAQLLDGKRNLVKESFALGLVATDDVDFRLEDDTKVLLSYTDATLVVLAVANAYEVNFQKYKDLKGQTQLATTQTDLNLIVW